MAPTGPRRPDDDDSLSLLTNFGEPGPNTLWIVVGRLAVVFTMVVVVRVGLREWHGATMAAIVVGAAWLLGRVD
jgi:hypothetical protein